MSDSAQQNSAETAGELDRVLRLAIVEGDTDTIKSLEGKIDFNLKSPVDGDTPLQYSAYIGRDWHGKRPDIVAAQRAVQDTLRAGGADPAKAHDGPQQDAETNRWWDYMSNHVPRGSLKALGVTNPREFGKSADALDRGREMFIFAAEATRAAQEQGKSDLFGVTIRPGPLVDPRDSHAPRAIEVSTRAGDMEKNITIRAGITEGETSHAEVLDYMRQVYTMAKLAGVSSPGMNVNYNAGEAEIVKACALHGGVSREFYNSTHASVPSSGSEPVIDTSSTPGEPVTRIPVPRP